VWGLSAYACGRDAAGGAAGYVQRAVAQTAHQLHDVLADAAACQACSRVHAREL
jgi:hypothetical protein